MVHIPVKVMMTQRNNLRVFHSLSLGERDGREKGDFQKRKTSWTIRVLS
jgi:hypothetical protein